MPRKVLVAIDGSKNADWAYHAAVHSLNPLTDSLFLLSVAHVTTFNSLSLIKTVLSQDFEEAAKAYVKGLEARAESILLSYVETTKQLGIKHYKAIMGTSSNVGELVVETAKKYNVDQIVVGTQGLGLVHSLVVGSCSRFVVENASCDVLVVKKEFVPAEVHTTTENEVKAAEEAERKRRLSDPVEALHAEDAATFSHRAVVLAPESASKNGIIHLSIKH